MGKQEAVRTEQETREPLTLKEDQPKEEDTNSNPNYKDHTDCKYTDSPPGPEAK
jgi:hypothetical protein